MGIVFDLLSGDVDPLADGALLVLAFVFSLFPKHRLFPDLILAAGYSAFMVMSVNSHWHENENMLNCVITGLLAGMFGLHSTAVVYMCSVYILVAAWNSPFAHQSEFAGVIVNSLHMCACCVLLEYRVACGVVEMMRVVQEATDGYFHCDPWSFQVIKVSAGLQKELGQWATQTMQQGSLLDVVDQRDHAALARNIGHRSSQTLLVTLRRVSEDGQRSTADCRLLFFNMSSSRLQQVCVQIQGEWRLEFDDVPPEATLLVIQPEEKEKDGPVVPAPGFHKASGPEPPAVAGSLPAAPLGGYLSHERVAQLPRGIALQGFRRSPLSEHGSTASERAVENVHADEVESIVGLQELASLGQEEHWMYSSRDLVLLPEKRLGEGSFGIVVVGRLHGTPVAVKLAKGGGASWDHRGWPELANELRLLRRIRHPHIVGFFGACMDPQSGIFAVLMELLSGTSLQDFVLETSTLEAQRHTVVLHLCHALRHLHTLVPVVVHGDLKPSNVIVEPSATGPKAKLLDFGLSRLLTKRVRAFVGSFAWRAPEVARGSEFCGTAADVFSLGRVCHFILTRQYPFEGIPAEAVKQMVKHPCPTQLEWPTLSCECSRLWDACLMFDPSLRPTIEEVDFEMTKVCENGINKEGQLREVSFEAAVQEICRPPDRRAGISARFSLADETYPIEGASADWLAFFGQIRSVTEAVPQSKVDDFRKFLEAEFERRFIAEERNCDKVVVFKRIRFTQRADKSVYKATLVVEFPTILSSLPSSGSGSQQQCFIAEMRLESLTLHRLRQPRPEVLPTLTETEEALHSERCDAPFGCDGSERPDGSLGLDGAPWAEEREEAH